MKKVCIGLKLVGVMCLVYSASAVLSGCASGTATTNNPPAISTTISTPTASTKTPVEAKDFVSVVPSKQTVKPGDTFDLSIRVKNIQASRGLQFALSWDPAKFQVVSTEQGNYFKEFVSANKGSLFVFPEPAAFDNAAGFFPKVTGAVKQMSIVMVEARDEGLNWLGVTGIGDVYVLHMSVKDGATGVGEFKLSDVILIDATQESGDLKAVVENGNVTISP